jgi:hypothetical protein
MGWHGLLLSALMAHSQWALYRELDALSHDVAATA